MSINADEMLTRKSVSIMKATELVDVSRRTIYNWMKAGKLDIVRTAGGSVRIFVESLYREAEASGAAVKAAKE